MIGISKLYCDESFEHDPLRYGEKSQLTNAHKQQKSADQRKPIVVWNITKTCNLRCIHCYTNSQNIKYNNELTTEEGLRVIDDLKKFEIPALLFSGGEPLMRPDFWELLSYASNLGLRCVISTNSTLITEENAEKLKSLNIKYVGASLDGMGETNDFFRGTKGAFEKTVQGIRNSKKAGLKISLRLTLTKHTVNDLTNIFKFSEDEDIDRICFYHLVASGRGKDIYNTSLSHEETRNAMDLILDHCSKLKEKGLKKDILTVDNHVDGVYLYLKLRNEDKDRAQKVKKLLEWNGGGANSSGVGIGNIDPQGFVHANQFWMDHSFGNVKNRPFSEIWTDNSDPLLRGLRNRIPLLKGKCGNCRFIKMCGGSLRVRAKMTYNDPWMEDPACYLTEKELSGE